MDRTRYVFVVCAYWDNFYDLPEQCFNSLDKALDYVKEQVELEKHKPNSLRVGNSDNFMEHIIQMEIK